MAPEWIYLLKANAGIALFYAFYKLFCQGDTFFQWRRFALLSFLGISFVYPLLDIQHWVKEQPAMNELADYYAMLMTTEAHTDAHTASSLQLPDLLTLCLYLYYIGVIALSLRLIMQLCSVSWMRWKGTPATIDGQRIISIPTEAAPFSFFGWIFLYLPALKEESRQEILKHELTHARQWHSADVILCELISIICWFNPFAWLMKSEIRLNLEYLADNKVAETMGNCKQYQYHLLSLVNKNGQTYLCNNFNVSHIKRRITMMNKKRTRTTGRIKYALFAPLAIALLLVSNIEAVARTAKEVLEDSILQQEKIHQLVDEQPEFPGGMMECMKFLAKNIKYPTEAIKNGIQGRVIVQMVIQKDGSIADAKVARSVDPMLDAEAIRVVNLMPKWKPGKHEGEAVNVRFTLPVVFKLSDPTKVEVKAKEEQYIPDDKGIYSVCEEMPEFPGGMGECMKFLAQNIKYPVECMKQGIQGRVIVQFIIDKDGKVRKPKVVRAVHPDLNKEALRVTRLMPKWKPGKVKGENVACRFTMPMQFSLR